MKYRQWNELAPGREDAPLRRAGIPALCAKVLAARGWGDGEEARRFLLEEPPLHDPLSMADMDRAAGRLRRALERRGNTSRSTATTTWTASPPPAF